MRVPAGLPPYLASLYDVPLLSREQEAHLFRKMNYLKYKAGKLRDELDPSQPKSSTMDEIEGLYHEAVSTKNQIIRANLRLVVSIAKRHVGPAENFFELVSDGNVSLMRAAEKFDFTRGYKFSTYASWAIMKNYARTIPDEHRYRDRFRTSQAEAFSSTRTTAATNSSRNCRTRDGTGKWKGPGPVGPTGAKDHRLGCGGDGQESRTLQQVGVEWGVTKQWIRHQEPRALSKLRKAAEEEKIDFPT